MIQRPQVIALASATSTNGTARNGANLATEFAVPGTIAVVCSASITTSSVLATFKLQLSFDAGTTWVDFSGPVASDYTFATAAGTGSPVTTTKTLIFPSAATSAILCRVVATLSGASTAGADVTSATYCYSAAGSI